jgi:hypothetical protein
VKRLFYFLVVAGAAIALYHVYQKSIPGAPKLDDATPLPKGAQFTGRTQMTTTGRPPNYPNSEVVGYARHAWAEIILPDGRTDWVAMADDQAS